MASSANPNPSQCEALDRVLILLFIGIVFFTGVLFAAELWFKDDSQLFQVVAGVLTGFTGAFFGRMKPRKEQGESGGDDNSTNITNPQAPVVAVGSGTVPESPKA